MMAKLYIIGYFKAFALTGRRGVFALYPGRCPGLGVSAISGRIGNNKGKNTLKILTHSFFPPISMS